MAKRRTFTPEFKGKLCLKHLAVKAPKRNCVVATTSAKHVDMLRISSLSKGLVPFMVSRQLSAVGCQRDSFRFLVVSVGVRFMQFGLVNSLL